MTTSEIITKLGETQNRLDHGIITEDDYKTQISDLATQLLEAVSETGHKHHEPLIKRVEAFVGKHRGTHHSEGTSRPTPRK